MVSQFAFYDFYHFVKKKEDVKFKRHLSAKPEPKGEFFQFLPGVLER